MIPDITLRPLSEQTYAQIGRVVVAGTGLECQLARFAEIILGDDYRTLMSGNTKARTRARTAVDTLAHHPLHPQLLAWLDEAGALLEDRNRVVHAIWGVIDFADGHHVFEGEHARSQVLLSPESSLLTELPAKLDDCASAGFKLMLDVRRKPGESSPIPGPGYVVQYANIEVVRKLAAELGLRLVMEDEDDSEPTPAPSS